MVRTWLREVFPGSSGTPDHHVALVLDPRARSTGSVQFLHVRLLRMASHQRLAFRCGQPGPGGPSASTSTSRPPGLSRPAHRFTAAAGPDIAHSTCRLRTTSYAPAGRPAASPWRNSTRPQPPRPCPRRAPASVGTDPPHPPRRRLRPTARRDFPSQQSRSTTDAGAFGGSDSRSFRHTARTPGSRRPWSDWSSTSAACASQRSCVTCRLLPAVFDAEKLRRTRYTLRGSLSQASKKARCSSTVANRATGASANVSTRSLTLAFRPGRKR